MQRCLSSLCPSIYISHLLQQKSHHLDIISHDSIMQWLFVLVMLEINISNSVLIHLFIQQICHLRYLSSPYSRNQISVSCKFDVPPVLPGILVRLLQYLRDSSFLLITAQVLKYPSFLLDGLFNIRGQLQGVILDTSVLQNSTRFNGIIIRV